MPSPNRKLWIALAAAGGVAVLALAAVTAGVVFWLGSQGDEQPAAAPSAASSADVAKQMECTSIQRQYASWKGGRTGLSALPSFTDPDVAGFQLDGLSEAGKDMLAAVSGYPDQPAKALAVAVSGYNVELSFLNLTLSMSGKLDEEAYDKAVAAQADVDAKYEAFMAATCG